MKKLLVPIIFAMAAGSTLSYAQGLGGELKGLENKAQGSGTSTASTPAPADLKSKISDFEKEVGNTKSSLAKNDHASAGVSVAKAKAIYASIAAHPSASNLKNVDYKGMEGDLATLDKAVKSKNTSDAKASVASLDPKLSSLKAAAGL